MKHYYDQIPGWFDFQDIYTNAVHFAPSDRGATFVEVGSCFGKSLSYMGVEIVNSGKRIALHSVDHGDVFQINDAFAGEAEHLRAKPWEGWTFTEILRTTMAPCVQAGLHYTHHQRKSDDTRGFGLVDFVFLDACHDYDGILAELRAWWPQVRSGGALGGHDHTSEYLGVVRAVKEFFPAGGVQITKSSFLIAKP